MKGLKALVLFIAIPAAAFGQGAPAADATVQRAKATIDSLLQRQQMPSPENENIIVEFKDAPMFIRQSKTPQLRIAPTQFESRFSQLVTDAENIRRALPSASSSHITIRRSFYKSFFGASTTVPHWMLPLIQNLPYVKAVHYDHEVRAFGEPAANGRRDVIPHAGSQGEGVRVGIIDTGIDYMHPALGGGFGPGFKVVGGYDFVNNDNDPMDDNGHGTHVAGIVAAESDVVHGVAPHVSLFAYKVLNAQGTALESEIIAAIERTVDPNQDGDDADRLDVVNMSLGTIGGSPTDPTSVAVDNATRLGVVFCIAAGNSGGFTPTQGKEENYFYDASSTIGSPGTAELAITVGACDSTDHVASFSSKGPNRVSYSIKPEVVAPGVNIISTFLSSGYATETGTSMATPMVTGVAALVKSAHPDWNSAQVKSAIVNSAKDLGRSAFLQGGGKALVGRASAARTLVVPSTLSAGMDDPSSGVWIRRDTLYVTNRDSFASSYVAVVGGLPPGVTLDFSPSLFSIPPRDSIRILTTLSVINAQLVIEEENILRYSGSVSLNGTSDTVRIPWAFTRTNRLVVTTSEPHASFVGFSSSSVIFNTDKTVRWTSPTRAEIFAPGKGVYEFFTLFRNPVGKSKLIDDEGIAVTTDAAEVSLDASRAIFPLAYHGVDHLGVPLHSYPSSRKTLITSFTNLGNWATTLTGGSDTLLLSAISPGHLLKPVEFQIDPKNTKSFHVIQYDKFAGMSGPRTVTNSPSNFIKENFKVKVPPGTPEAVNITILYSSLDINGTSGFSGLGVSIDTLAVNDNGYSFAGYFGKSPIPQEDVAVQIYTSYSDTRNLSLDYLSGFIMPYKDSIAATPREAVTPAIPRFESGATMELGGTPIHLHTIWYNNTFGTNSLHFRTIFRGMLNEERTIDNLFGTYSLFDKNGNLLFTKSLADPRSPLTLTGDRYRMVMTSSNHWLRHARGTITLTSAFNLGNGFSSNPPMLTALEVFDITRHPTDGLAHGENGSILFAFADGNFTPNVVPIFDSTKAWFRMHGSTTWTPLSISRVGEVPDKEGLIVSANLAAATTMDSVAVDLRMATTDVNGFTTDYVISPAFAVGNWDTTLVTDVKEPGTHNMPLQFALEQNYPNPFNPKTAISFQLSADSKTRIAIYDLLGREVTVLVDGVKAPGEYAVTWDAGGFPSGVYICRMIAGSFVRVKKLVLLK